MGIARFRRDRDADDRVRGYYQAMEAAFQRMMAASQEFRRVMQQLLASGKTDGIIPRQVDAPSEVDPRPDGERRP